MSLDFRDRQRIGSFVSPSGVEQEFTTNTLIKRGGKKVSTQEIVDSNESVSQSQGNITDVFPISMYFIGDDSDVQQQDFEKLLREDGYTLITPGILHHPMWGDIDVFPITWELTTELVDGVGVSAITVEFTEVFKIEYPDSTLNNADLASSELDDMSLIDSASQMALSTAKAASNVAGKIQAVVGIISKAVETLEKIEEDVIAAQNEISLLIDDVAGNIVSLLFVTQRLMRAPSRFQDNTLNKISTYRTMITDIANAIKDEAETDIVNLRNNAVLMQSFAGYAVGCLSEASLYTSFFKRVDAISVIDSIGNALDEFNSFMSDAWTDGNVSEEYSGDHNFNSFLFDMTLRTREILLNKAFDLKAEKTFILKANSNTIELCYEYYGDVQTDTVQFFIETNDIINDEFTELPAGRSVTVYV